MVAIDISMDCRLEDKVQGDILSTLPDSTVTLSIRNFRHGTYPTLNFFWLLLIVHPTGHSINVDYPKIRYAMTLPKTPCAVDVNLLNQQSVMVSFATTSNDPISYDLKIFASTASPALLIGVSLALFLVIRIYFTLFTTNQCCSSNIMLIVVIRNSST